MNVKGKYLKDEDGNIISPVASTDTIYYGTTKLSTQLNSFTTTLNTHNTSINGLKGTTLFSGSSFDSNVNLSQNLFNYTHFIMTVKTGKSTDTPAYSPYYTTGLLPVVNNGQYTTSFPTAICEADNWRQYTYCNIYKISSSANTTISYQGGFFGSIYLDDNTHVVNLGWSQNDTSNLQVTKVVGYKI